MMIKCDLSGETYCVYANLYFHLYYFVITMLFYLFFIFMAICNCRLLNVKDETLFNFHINFDRY